MTIDDLNRQSKQNAAYALLQCCTSGRWVERMLACRPFFNFRAVHEAADQSWLALDEGDYLQAFEGHPKIGDVNSLRAKYANTKALASGEQSAVSEATDEVLIKLSEGNDAYFNKFGFIFIVCATGKSAGEMLALLEARLPNTRDIELQNAAEEQRKIFHIRLEKLL